MQQKKNGMKKIFQCFSKKLAGENDRMFFKGYSMNKIFLSIVLSLSATHAAIYSRPTPPPPATPQTALRQLYSGPSLKLLQAAKAELIEIINKKAAAQNLPIITLTDASNKLMYEQAQATAHELAGWHTKISTIIDDFYGAYHLAPEPHFRHIRLYEHTMPEHDDILRVAEINSPNFKFMRHINQQIHLEQNFK